MFSKHNITICHQERNVSTLPLSQKYVGYAKHTKISYLLKGNTYTKPDCTIPTKLVIFVVLKNSRYIDSVP